MKKSVAIVWAGSLPQGKISIRRGKVSALEIEAGRGIVEGDGFRFRSGPECRLVVTAEDISLEEGGCPSILNVRSEENPFSVFIRDINLDFPVLIPEYKVAVTDASDSRSFSEMLAAIRSLALSSRLEAIDKEPEESFENADSACRSLQCVTWLGLSRDVRIFEAGFRAGFYTGPVCENQDFIRPKFHNEDVTLPELDGAPVRYCYFAGRGIGCAQGLTRGLEEGTLPVLNAKAVDDDVSYSIKMFATNEKSPLTAENLRGTHYLVSDHYSRGSTLTEEQRRLKDTMQADEMDRDEETVVYLRIRAVNDAKAPRYCWVSMPRPEKCVLPEFEPVDTEYDSGRGFASFKKDRVFIVADFNGKPMPQPEMAVLLKPGETAEFTFKIPHSPISEARAAALSGEDFTRKLEECIRFWKTKLARPAQLSVPEKRVDEMMKAGLLHLDLICYGNEPDEPVAPTVGRYSPIGSESSPIIQYFDSMGRGDLARRCLMYFIKKQHDDGFMQNFRTYMLETGAVLWNIGEHYRYTRDVDWIKSIRGNIIKACDCLISWRNRNKREELRGKGYGLLDGKVADPQDNYHLFMLNGFAYLGLSRSAEALAELDEAASERIGTEAGALKKDIRAELMRCMAESPVIPLGNGFWCPTAPPWAEAHGPVSLYADPGQWFTHDTFTTRDALLGPTYLLLQEVVSPAEPMGGFILQSCAELFFSRNTAFSQPYYSTHPYVHLRRGEVKAFLKEYYNAAAGLADRATYTFWEHFSHVSAHKTHEEAWFLMRSRWMLYLEEGNTLKLLPGIPRAWLEQGKRICIDGMMSYFGPLFLEVFSDLGNGRATVSFRIDAPASRLPESVCIRIPYPMELKVTDVSAGRYCPQDETVTIEGFEGKLELEVKFELSHTPVLSEEC